MSSTTGTTAALLVSLILVIVATATAIDAPWRSGPDGPKPADRPAFEFVKGFTTTDLYSNATAQDQFKRLVAYWEGKFHSNNVGIDEDLAITFDGTAIDPTTGLPTPDGLHVFSAASKEALHLAMLSLAISNDPYARIFFGSTIGGVIPTESDLFARSWTISTAMHSAADDGSSRHPPKTLRSNSHSNSDADVLDLETDPIVDRVFTILERKLNTYVDFRRRFPGFAGFLPWYRVVAANATTSDPKHIEPNPDFAKRVPALDNGEWIWGMYAVVKELELVSGSSPRAQRLHDSYSKFLQQTTDNLMLVFFEPSANQFRVVTKINDPLQPPSATQYSNEGTGFLNDPYEGELFVIYADLFCKWESDEQRDKVWVLKRPMLKPRTLSTPLGNITVQRGYWYSAHEQWKILQSPYLFTSAREVFVNCERARTWYSFLTSTPGLFASVAGVEGVCGSGGYISDCGIPSLAYVPVSCQDIVTPYGATPLLAIDEFRPIGLLWYANMLNGTRMQGPYGSTESADRYGNNIAPVLTWDSKINGLLGMLGGTGHRNVAQLKSDGKWDRFRTVIEREYSLAFPTLEGTNIPMAFPPFPLPNHGGFK